MNEDRILIKGGTIVSMDPSIGDLSKGDLLIEGNKIIAVAEEISSDRCEVIDASGAIVIPGLIDTHKHMWQTVLRGVHSDWVMAQYGLMVRTIYPVCFEPEDAYISNHAGALEAIDAGVTMVVDHSHLQTSPETTDALIQGSLDAGIGGFFCYGLYNNPTYSPGGPIDIEEVTAQVLGVAEAWHYENAARAKARFFTDSDGPLRFGISTSEHMGVLSADEIEKELKAAQRLEPELITSHVGTMLPSNVEDLSSRPEGPPWVREMNERNLLKENMIFSHCNGLLDEEFEMLARNGVSISSTVYSELDSVPTEVALEQARRAGMAGSLGSDIPVLNTADMFAQARTLLLIERSKRAGEPNAMASGTANPATLEYLKILTSEAAEAVGLGDLVGSLTPGKRADIVMLSTDALNMFPVNNVGGAVMFQANVRDVDTVIIAGKIRKRNGTLVDVDLPAIRERLNAAQERIAEKAAKVSPEELIPVWSAGTLWDPDKLK